MSKSQHPTIGPTVEIEQGACLLFERWLPLAWPKRRQTPDIHLDYRVEFVQDGEPRGRHFSAQIKGRNLQGRKGRKITERFKSKHLLYYMRCEEPVYLFLIDPVSEEGYWLFAQRYIKDHLPDLDQRGEDKLTVAFSSEASLACPEAFHTDLKQAWPYVRDLHPGSPMAAISAEKEKWGKLDTAFDIDVHASATSQHISVSPKSLSSPLAKIKFLNPPSQEKLIQFHEKGYPLKFKANEITFPDSPLHEALLRELGDSEVTIQGDQQFPGCIQLKFMNAGEGEFFQVDGVWNLSRKRISFAGRLADTPISIMADSEQDEAGEYKLNLNVSFDWAGWGGQPIGGLSYFQPVAAFARTGQFGCVFRVKGNRFGNSTDYHASASVAKQISSSMTWLERCRSACLAYGFNPVLPSERLHEHLNAEDLHTFVKLMETKYHEQSTAGTTLELEVDCDSSDPFICGESSPAEIVSQSLDFDLFGQKIQFGPAIVRCTNLLLEASSQVGSNRTKMRWKGRDDSVYSITYNPPTRPQNSPVS